MPIPAPIPIPIRYQHRYRTVTVGVTDPDTVTDTDTDRSEECREVCSGRSREVRPLPIPKRQLKRCTDRNGSRPTQNTPNVHGKPTERQNDNAKTSKSRGTRSKRNEKPFRYRTVKYMCYTTPQYSQQFFFHLAVLYKKGKNYKFFFKKRYAYYIRYGVKVRRQGVNINSRGLMSPFGL